MIASRTDLPLDRDSHTRFLPWLIAFMIFMSVMAMVGMMVLDATAERWDSGVTGTLTVQVPPADAPRQEEARIQAVLLILRTIPEIVRADVIPRAETLAMLEPWLGAGGGGADLPLPRLINVELKEDGALDTGLLADRLAAAAPGISVDDHRVWLRRLVQVINAIEGLAGVALALILGVTVWTIVYTTRSGLAVHHEAIEVLHLIGAQDGYIAGQFAGRALLLGLKGGLIGLALTAPALGGIGYLAGRLEPGLLPDLKINAVQWILLGCLPLAVALLANLTARFTVLGALKRML